MGFAGTETLGCRVVPTPCTILAGIQQHTGFGVERTCIHECREVQKARDIAVLGLEGRDALNALAGSSSEVLRSGFILVHGRASGRLWMTRGVDMCSRFHRAKSRVVPGSPR